MSFPHNTECRESCAVLRIDVCACIGMRTLDEVRASSGDVAVRELLDAWSMHGSVVRKMQAHESAAGG